MVLGKHRPKVAGLGVELTEFHSEKKKTHTKFWFEKVKEINHRRYKDVDGNIILKCYIGSASTVVTIYTTQCTAKRSALCLKTTLALLLITLELNTIICPKHQFICACNGDSVSFLLHLE